MEYTVSSCLSLISNKMTACVIFLVINSDNMHSSGIFLTYLLTFVSILLLASNKMIINGICPPNASDTMIINGICPPIG